MGNAAVVAAEHTVQKRLAEASRDTLPGQVTTHLGYLGYLRHLRYLRYLWHLGHLGHAISCVAWVGCHDRHIGICRGLLSVSLGDLGLI